ncbi:MAG TPA: alpha-(1-_3)-arabinofuranosyltransferase family protein [Candidatus Nanopelagicales bacterium]|nr:alpha-(1->3)-arabinofuranosyltransferase family protein [Candidatus Nanopelagicales bacterium]
MTTVTSLPETPSVAAPPAAVAFDRDRARMWAVIVALVAAAFVQWPGKVAADTKVDLYENPWGLLARALHLWDPQTASGALQNQAYGYLFPQGPFYGVLHSLGVPAWVAQRLWWALLLVVAFLGMRQLLRVLRIGTPTIALLGGVVFALSPRILSTMGQVSSEVWPMAMAPWVLVPLVRHGMLGGDPRRAAARSGAAFLLVGAVNAAASLAVLVLPFVYLATRRWSRDSLRTFLWWTGSIALASLWWLVPLVLLGRYSPPFLDWIESSAVTTSPDSLANATRGVTAWLPYLAGGRGEASPAGWMLVAQPVVVLDTAVLAALGVAGLVRRDLRDRLWLVAGALVGLTLLAVAWVGPVGPPFAEEVRAFLDGAGSPLRNIHKFDVVLRIPLVIGLAHLVATVRLQRLRQARWTRDLVPIVAVVAAIGAAAPLLVGQVGAAAGYVAVPDYWKQTAAWLNGNATETRTLVVPGSQPAAYLWGTTGDDVLQPLLDTSWAVRDGVPLGSAGNTRMLDAVEQALANGRGSSALPDFLARAGVGFVVARNDVDWARLGTTRPILVHAALVRSGLTRVASFGPLIGGSQSPDLVIDGGLGVDLPAVEVWQVPGLTGPVTRVAPGPVLSGGPEDLLAVAEAGVVGTAPTTLAGEPGEVRADIVTAGYRRREVNFGNSRANASSTMSASDEFVAPRKVHDYWPIAPAGNQTVADFPAGRPEASSSGATPTASRNRSNGWGAAQAFDGDERTEWRSASRTPVDEWVGVRDLPSTVLGRVVVRLDTDPTLAQVREIEVAAGSTRRPVAVGPDGTASVDLGGVTATAVRVTITRVADGSATRSVAVREIELGRSVPRLLQPARVIDPGTTVVLTASADRRDGCVYVGERPLCSDVLPRPGEEDAGLAAELDIAAAGRWDLSLQARAVGGPALDQLLVPVGPAMDATASSSLVPDAGGRPQTVVDRDLGTGWVAGRGEQLPRLTLTWPEVREVSGLRLLHDASLAASVATSVLLSFDGADPLTVPVDSDGRVEFPPVRATSVAIVPVALHPRKSLDPATGATRTLPWGVSEVEVVGADSFRRAVPSSARTGLPCGFGPSLVVDGVPEQTRISATIGDLMLGRPVTVAPCRSNGLRLSAGPHRVALVASGEFVPESLVLTPPGARRPVDAGAVAPGVWGPVHREVAMLAAPGDTQLVVRENANAGWTATLDGTVLQPVRIDGWEQGWWIPAGVSGTVSLDFGPDATYRRGLLLGLLAALVLATLALVPARSRSATPAAAGAFVGRGASSVAAPLVGAVLGGLPGLGIGVVARLAAVRASDDLLSIVAGSAVALSGALAALAPWPTNGAGAFGAGAQILSLVAVCVLAGSGGRGSVRRSTSPDEPAQPEGRALDDVPGDGGH